MECGGWEGMVVVVPSLAEGWEREPGEVPGLIPRRERLAPEHVAEGVDAVGDVVDDEHTHCATPQNAGEAGGDRAADRDPEPERHRQSKGRPDEEGAIDEPDHRVAKEVRSEATLASPLGVDEEPAQVSVEEASQDARPAAAVTDVGAMGVALAIRAGVMLAMVGNPRDDRALDRGRPERCDHPARHRAGGEAAMREEPMEADCDAEPGGDVGDGEDRKVAPTQGFVPELPPGEPEEQERNHRDEPRDHPVGGLVRNRLDCLGEGRRLTSPGGCVYQRFSSGTTAAAPLSPVRTGLRSR